MAYTKQNFEDGQVLKAEHLNNMETGIDDVTNSAVMHTAQSLADAQKKQALTNIGAASKADLDSANGAINLTMLGLGASQAGALKWDGIIGDKAYITMAENTYLVHVTDEVPTVLADMPIATLGYTALGEGTLSQGIATEITAASEDGLYICGEMFVVIVPTDNYTIEAITFPKKGVYFFTYNGIASGIDFSYEYVSSLMVAGYSFSDVSEPVDNPLILSRGYCDSLRVGSRVIGRNISEFVNSVMETNDDGTTDYTIRVAGGLLPAATATAYMRIYTTAGEIYTKTSTLSKMTTGYYMIGQGHLVFITSDYSGYDQAAEKGIADCWLASVTADADGVIISCSLESCTIYGEAVFEEEAFDERYIPNAIQRVGDDVIIHSSTANSTKKFRLIVDDSGAISATEV